MIATKEKITLLFFNALTIYCIPSVVKALFFNLSVVNIFGKKNQFGKSTENKFTVSFCNAVARYRAA